MAGQGVHTGQPSLRQAQGCPTVSVDRGLVEQTSLEPFQILPLICPLSLVSLPLLWPRYVLSSLNTTDRWSLWNLSYSSVQNLAMVFSKKAGKSRCPQRGPSVQLGSSPAIRRRADLLPSCRSLLLCEVDPDQPIWYSLGFHTQGRML